MKTAASADEPTTDTATKVVDAAIRTFARYGGRKTAMVDIAREADVSRKTLYDHFGTKDELIAASIRRVTDLNLARLEVRLNGLDALSDQIDVYFSEITIRSFEVLQTSNDPEDVLGRQTAAGQEELTRSYARHAKLIARLLAPRRSRIETSGQSHTQLAHFFVTTAMALKYSAKNRRDLNGLLASLKAATISIAQ